MRRGGSLAATLGPLAVLVALVLAVLSGAPPARGAGNPFDRDTSQEAAADRPAAESARLLGVADAWRADPLFVDPEIPWAVDPAARRSLRRALERARVPVLVAVLPSLDEDESGGDSERTLQALQRLVRRDAVYVVADQRGWFDLASMGIPLDLSVPYSLTMPRRDWSAVGDEDREPDPPGYTSLADRLEKMLTYVAAAKPGTPNGPIADDDVRPLDELSSASGYDASEDLVAAVVLGLIFGLIAAAIVLGIRKLVISHGAGNGPGRPGEVASRSGRAGGPSGSGPGKRRGGRRRAAKRRGRRGA